MVGWCPSINSPSGTALWYLIKKGSFYTGNAIPFTGSWDRTVPIHMHLINGVLDIESFGYGTGGAAQIRSEVYVESKWVGGGLWGWEFWKYRPKLCYTWKSVMLIRHLCEKKCRLVSHFHLSLFFFFFPPPSFFFLDENKFHSHCVPICRRTPCALHLEKHPWKINRIGRC